MENRSSAFSNHIFLIVAILILGTSLVVSFFYIRNNKPDYSSSPPASAGATPSLEVVKRVLLGKTKIIFPGISSSSIIPIDKLPKDLNAFLFDNSTNVSTRAINYTDGAKGYQIEYTTNLSWRNVNYRFLGFIYPPSSSSWSILGNSLAELFGFVEMDNSRYQVRVEQTLNNNQGVLIFIQTISK